MEELVRELKANHGLYLIHGDDGVGKTRLLEELARSSLADSKVFWMDLQAGGAGEGVLVDSSEMIERSFFQCQSGRCHHRRSLRSRAQAKPATSCF